MSDAKTLLTRANAVLPLRWASNDFLQVLVKSFMLQRQAGGVQLKLRLDDGDDAICLRQAKRIVQSDIEDFAARSGAYQEELDRFLLEGKGEKLKFPRDDRPFPFRYASGGTLPIVRISQRPDTAGRPQPAKEYYALFYREVSPVGWNIANGGCDTREELLQPRDTVARELREELLLIDVRNRRRYVFGEDLGKSIDRPEFAAARKFWNDILKLKDDDLEKFEVIEVPVKWFNGPDELAVSMGRGTPYPTRGCFLNINALDFGIEIDCVAKIHIDQDVRLCDGEQLGDGLVNAPIGLFEVESFNERFKKGMTQFRPDKFFWSGVLYEGDELDEVIERDWLPGIPGIHESGELEEYEKKKTTNEQYDLCPVTSRIVHRFVHDHKVPADLPKGPFRVFLSYASEDGPVAERVFNHVQSQLGGGVFFSKRTMTDTNFSKAIDDALEEANCLIVVGTKLEHLTKGWVEWEWRTFHNLINSGLKPKGAQLVPYIGKGFSPVAMPLPLRQRDCVQVDRPGDEVEGLNRWLTAR